MTLLLLGAGKQTVAGGAAAPLFSSAEIGTVDASTLVVTFDRDVSAADYSAGVTIKVNGSATSITSATRQANHAIVHYVIPVLWHGSGDVVTWEYSAAGGNIVSEVDSTPLADVTAQSVTNNCEYAALLDLQADTLALGNGDPVSTWADQSGNGRDFTQTGNARPTKQTIGGYSTVSFDGVDDYMIGTDFADNLSSFTILHVVSVDQNNTNALVVIAKKFTTPSDPGWADTDGSMTLLTDNANSLSITNVDALTSNKIIICDEVISFSAGDVYINGSKTNSTIIQTGTVTSTANNNPVTIAMQTGDEFFTLMNLYAVLICTAAPSSTNRAALEARLAARYGVIL